MDGPRPLRLTRRDALRAAGLAGVTMLAASCGRSFDDVRLTIATGGTQGVYYALGGALADAWEQRLSLPQRPQVLSTDGSKANLDLLEAGTADVAFSAADAAAINMAATVRDEGRRPAALARLYDDVVHVVVRADGPARRLADLRGLRVSIGAANSGVLLIAQRCLTAVGLSPERDLVAANLGINDSVTAMRDGKIDAFFWSGGLPTAGVSELATSTRIRLLDTSDAIPAIRQTYPVYEIGTVPASSYGIDKPVTTLFVRNFLLITRAMADDVAEALVGALFDARPLLAQASSTARTIDQRSAIGTQPIPLHPGAENYYRAAKQS